MRKLLFVLSVTYCALTFGQNTIKVTTLSGNNPYYIPGADDGSVTWAINEAVSGDTIDMRGLIGTIDLNGPLIVQKSGLVFVADTNASGDPVISLNNKIQVTGDENSFFNFSIIQNNGGGAISISQGGTQNTFTNVDINVSSGRGVEIQDSPGNTFTDITIAGPSGEGISVERGASNIFNDVAINNVSNHGVYLNDADGSVFNGLTVDGVNQNGLYVNASSGVTVDDFSFIDGPKSGIQVQAGGSDDLILTNGEIAEFGEFGLNFNDNDGLRMTSVYIHDNALNQDVSPAAWSGIRAYGYLDSWLDISYAGIQISSSYDYILDGNTVSGNKGHGIKIVDGSATATARNSTQLLINNNVGASLDSTTSFGNFGEGITVVNSAYVQVGLPNQGNWVTSNGNKEAFPGDGSLLQDDGLQTSMIHGHGIDVRSSWNVTVQSNYVGTDATGNGTLDINSDRFGNDLNGIYVISSDWNLIGGSQNSSEGNVVSGNGFAFENIVSSDSPSDLSTVLYGVRHGIQLDAAGDGVEGNQVFGNTVGLGVNGTSCIPNSEDGISVLGYAAAAVNNTVGGSTEDEGNIVGGSNFGIAFQGRLTSGNTVQNNTIGASDRTGTATCPVQESGIKMQGNDGTGGANNNSITGNYIVGSLGTGIEVWGAGAIENELIDNVIICTQDDGIMLDDGGNNLHGGVLLNTVSQGFIDGTVASGFTPNNTDVIHVYVADTTCSLPCQQTGTPTANGSALKLVGTATIGTNSYTDPSVADQAYWSYDFTSAAAIDAGLTPDNIIVTSTDEDGNTSQFNVCVQVLECDPPVSIDLAGENLSYCEGDVASAVLTATAVQGGSQDGELNYALYESTDLNNKIGQNATGEFTVTEAGEYVVVAFDTRSEVGCAITSQSITVDSIALPNTGAISRIIPNDSICPGDAGVEFQVAADPAYSYDWSITGDASIIGSTQGESIVVDFGESGNVTIEVVASIVSGDLTCVSDSSATHTVVVNDTPLDNDIIGLDSIFCKAQGEVYTLANLGNGSSFNWVSLPQGASIASANGADSSEVTINFDVFSGDLIVIETSEYGCEGAADTLNIVPIGCAITASFVPDQNDYCFGETTVLTSNSSFSEAFTKEQLIYTWDLPGVSPSTQSGTGLTEISVDFPTAGDFNVTLTVEDPVGTVDDTVITITVKDLPALNPSDLVFDDEACPNTSADIKVIDDGLGALYAFQDIDAFGTDTSFNTQYVTDDFDFTIYKQLDGCIDSISGQVAIFDETEMLSIDPVDPICAYETTTIRLNGATATSKFIWQLPEGASFVNTDTLGSEVEVRFGTKSGVVTVYEETINGCTAQDKAASVDVDVLTNPLKPSINGSDIVCKNVTGEFSVRNVIAGIDYDWFVISNGATDTFEDQNSISLNFTADAQIILRATNDIGCNTDSDTLSVFSAPVPEEPLASGPTELCEQIQDTVFLTMANGDTLLDSYVVRWSQTSEITRISNTSDQFVFRASDGGAESISYEITDTNGCKETWRHLIDVKYEVENTSIDFSGRVCDVRDLSRRTKTFNASASYADWFEWEIDDSTLIFRTDYPDTTIYDIFLTGLVGENISIAFDSITSLNEDDREFTLRVRAGNECNDTVPDEITFKIEESREFDLITNVKDRICYLDTFEVSLQMQAGADGEARFLEEWAVDDNTVFEYLDYDYAGYIYPRYQIQNDTIFDSTMVILPLYEANKDGEDSLVGYDTLAWKMYYDQYNHEYSYDTLRHYYIDDTILVHNTYWYNEVMNGDTLVTWVETDRCIITDRSTLRDTTILNMLYPANTLNAEADYVTISPSVDMSIDPDSLGFYTYVVGLADGETDQATLTLQSELNAKHPNYNRNEIYYYEWYYVNSFGDTVKSSFSPAQGTYIKESANVFGFDVQNTKVTTPTEPKLDELTIYQEVYYVQDDEKFCPSVDSIKFYLFYDIFIPTIFSPNGDGNYDFWEILNVDQYPDIDIEVYNRWGALVYESKGGYENDWDGVSSVTGEPLPDATYFFIVHFNDEFLDDMYKGSVTIMR